MPAGNTAFTFLQISDVHLDSKFASGRLRLPPQKRAARNRELLEALISGLNLAKERELQAVVIPGDLWDSESITSQTFNELVEALTAVQPLPVFIAPGNHDYCSNDSLYSGATLRSRGMRAWPSNVFILSNPEFESFIHPQFPDVSFTGRAFSGNVPVTERLLAADVPRPQNSTRILLFHGSLDGYTGRDSTLPGKRTAPFSASELETLGFDYAAIGHYHDCTEIRNAQAKVIGAYSGCLVGRGIDESGVRTALIVRLEPGQEPSLEKVELARRRVVVTSCDISRRTRQEVIDDVEKRLDRAGARPDLDLVYLQLEGRHPIGGEPRFVEEIFAPKYYHFVVSDESRPDYLLDQIDARTTEGKFVRSLLELKKQAESAGGIFYDTKHGELSVTTIDDALYYGMDALKQKKVAVRYVD